MEVITRAEAKAKGLKRYYTGKSCKHGHVAERNVSTGKCSQCVVESSRKQRESNPEKARGDARKSYRKNKDKRKDYRKKYYVENKGKMLAGSKAKYEENPEYFRKRSSEYQKKNRPKRNVINSRRKAFVRQASVFPEIYKEEIEFIYWTANRLTQILGTEYQVDHIIPIKGKQVKGLHIPINLQILTRLQNTRKNNTFNPEDHEYKRSK